VSKQPIVCPQCTATIAEERPSTSGGMVVRPVDRAAFVWDRTRRSTWVVCPACGHWVRWPGKRFIAIDAA
jgi:hypothetical protein